MSDNVSVTPGTGATIATRDAGGGVEVQRVIPNTFAGGVATDLSATNPLPATTTLKDGVLSNLATVAVFHNNDNQALPANSYGLNTGGVAQVLNQLGNLDRQRETGADNISSVGIATGAQQLALPFSTTIAAAITLNSSPQVVTPVAMSGTIRGSAWSIQVGSQLTYDTGTNKEVVFVSAVTATTFTAIFSKTHTGGQTLTGFVYNQARDASTPDGSALTGFGGGMTYFLNATLNSGSGGVESERSAAGELDGASGSGTAVAAEYENNSGGPPLVSGLASTLQFDRGRNVSGKGLGTATITAPAAAATSIAVPTASQVNLLQPGAPLYLLTGTVVTEVVYVSQTYVSGTSPITLQNPVVTGGETTAVFDIYAPAGPGLNGFMPTGIEIAEEALWDPVTNKFYIERAATQDAMPASNIVAEAPALYNGTNCDRLRGAQGVAETSMGGRQTTAVASGTAANTVIKGTPGRIGRILITATGTNPLQIFDNATTGTGTIIGALAASPAIGTVVDFQLPAANGITVLGSATNPGFTLSWT